VSKFFYSMISLIFIAGCSSSPNVETNVKTTQTNAVVSKANDVANQAIVSATNQPNLNAASANDKIIIQNSMVSRDNIRNTKDKKGAGAGDTPIAPNVSQAVIAAPDDSEIRNTMNAKGLPLEIRQFKNHPILVKIERTDTNNRDVKVYLRNGKVVKLPESQANDFSTAPASEIVKAIGLN